MCTNFFHNSLLDYLQAGYRDNTLGLPRLCPQDNINKIDKKDVYTYMSNFHDPSRMVLCGVGVEHDRLVELARDLFVKKTPIWKEDPSLVDPSKSVDHSVAQYTGGKVLVSVCFVHFISRRMNLIAQCVIGLYSNVE